jgi:hypothetical protein
MFEVPTEIDSAMMGKAPAIAGVAASKGKGPATAGPSPLPMDPAIAGSILSTKDPPSIEDGEIDLFAIAKQVDKLIGRLSTKDATRVLSMAGGLKNLRVISMDRPIGPVTQLRPGTGNAGGVVSTAPAGSVKRQGPTPKAAWKQTEDYRLLSAQHRGLVRDLKATPTGVLDKDSQRISLVAALRVTEQKLRDLKVVPSLGES